MAVYLYLCKAFDTVIHRVILLSSQSNRNKLPFLTIHIYSSEITINNGVRQRSVRDTLLYLIHTNDLLKVAHKSKLCLIAEYSNIFVFGKSIE